jgi:hypothetical protein
LDVEQASASIDALIERRASRHRAASLEAMWAQSERQQRIERRRQLREEWSAYHGRMHTLHLSLADEHALKRASLLLEAVQEEDEPGRSRGGGG